MAITPPSCDDSDCTTNDSYNTTTCECENVAITPPDCDDADCNTVDIYNTDTCECESNPVVPGSCDDNDCTTDDSYNTQTCECENVAITPPNCDDNDCTTTDSYNTSTCQCENVAITPPNCDDGCPDTVDSYDAVNCECENTLTPPDCDDGCPDTADSYNLDICGCENIFTAPNCDDNDCTTTDSYNTTNCQCENVAITNPICLCPTIAEVFISEIHYDNTGGDIGEFVEVAILNSATVTLADLTITLYDGSTGATYDALSLDSFVSGDNDGTYTYYTWSPSSIQDGSPDGLALDCTDNVLQFLSYEGAFDATDGPANGVTSANIGASEPDDTAPDGSSIQLVDNIWVYTSGANSAGSTNTAIACPTFTAAPDNVTFTESTCSTGCIPDNGAVIAPMGIPCPAESKLEYTVDGGTTWTENVPVYNQTTEITVQTRCICETDATQMSMSSAPVTSTPGSCINPDFTPTFIQPLCTTDGEISFSGTGLTFEVSINSGTYASIMSPIELMQGEQDEVIYEIRATDGNGCTSSQTVNVVAVEDCAPITAPIIECRQPTSTCNEADECGNGDIYIKPPFVLDQGAGGIVITNDAPDFYPLGTTVVTWTVTDMMGNFATCTSLVIIADEQDPNADECPYNFVVNSPYSGSNLPEPTFSDNCGISSIENNAPTSFPQGITTVVWEATDNYGNIGICTYNVTVQGGGDFAPNPGSGNTTNAEERSENIDFDKVFALSLSPNPANSFVSVHYELPENERGNIVIYNLLGRAINRSSVTDSRTSTIFDTSSYSNGIYLIELKLDNGKRKVMKFAVQH